MLSFSSTFSDVLLVLEDGTEGGAHELTVERVGSEEQEGSRPVDGLRDGGGLAEVHRTDLLREGGELLGEAAADARDAQLEDFDLAGGGGVVEKGVQASSSQGVGQVTRAVARQDEEGLGCWRGWFRSREW